MGPYWRSNSQDTALLAGSWRPAARLYNIPHVVMRLPHKSYTRDSCALVPSLGSACASTPSNDHSYICHHAATDLDSSTITLHSVLSRWHVNMSEDQPLVDLSLFSLSPADDRHFAVHDPEFNDDQSHLYREYSRPLQGNLTNKPWLRRPQGRLCPGASVARTSEEDSRCILARIRRTVTPPTINRDRDRDNTLLQRRNPSSVPRLTLSVPQSSPRHRHAASAMTWMPDEQMWLIESEVQRNVLPAQTAYPSPPAYSPPRNPPLDRSRSVPTSSIPPLFDLTPPLTPIQAQLQTLIQPPGEDGLSPLFQEAMNSVPMTDPMDLEQPSIDRSSQDDFRAQRAQTTYESLPQSLSPRASEAWQIPARSRSASVTTRSSRVISDTSSSRSFHSARESISDDLTEPRLSARRWHGLARRIARTTSSASS